MCILTNSNSSITNWSLYSRIVGSQNVDSLSKSPSIELNMPATLDLYSSLISAISRKQCLHFWWATSASTATRSCLSFSDKRIHCTLLWSHLWLWHRWLDRCTTLGCNCESITVWLVRLGTWLRCSTKWIDSIEQITGSTQCGTSGSYKSTMNCYIDAIVNSPSLLVHLVRSHRDRSLR